MRLARARLVLAVGTALALAGAAGCGSGSTPPSSSSGTGQGSEKVTLTYSVWNDPVAVAASKSLVSAFQKANPNITVKTDTRPTGGEGDNVVKTRLSTGDMADVFLYNSGSLLQALNPQRSLLDLTGDPALKAVKQEFLPAVTQGGKVYGVPFDTSMGGGILYNRKVYAQLGLQVPKTWTEFQANNDKIKAAGITPVAAAYKDAWTAQLLVLANQHNVQAKTPTWAEDFTANKAKFAADPAALAGFQYIEEARTKGWNQRSAGSTTHDQAVAMLAQGKAAHYPMLTFAAGAVAEKFPSAAQDIGFFGVPGDGAKPGTTLWLPNALYISAQTKNKEAAKQFLAFVASPAGAAAFVEGAKPSGPFLVNGAVLPADVLPVVKDLQAYLDAGAVTPALEFVSPVKGPSLDKITAAIGTGTTSGQDGAAQYDRDVEKQAKQLGLPGW